MRTERYEVVSYKLGFYSDLQSVKSFFSAGIEPACRRPVRQLCRILTFVLDICKSLITSWRMKSLRSIVEHLLSRMVIDDVDER